MFENFKIKFEKGKKGLWTAYYNSTPFRRNAIYSLRQCGSRQKNTGSTVRKPSPSFKLSTTSCATISKSFDISRL